MDFSLISIGNNYTALAGRPTGVDRAGFGKRRAAVKSMTSKAQAPLEWKASHILAITVPVATVLTSMSWAMAMYLTVREKYRAQVELARFEAEAKMQIAPVSEAHLLVGRDDSTHVSSTHKASHEISEHKQ